MRSQKRQKKIMIAVTIAVILSMVIFGYINNLNRSIKEKDSQLKENQTLLSQIKDKGKDLGNVIEGPSTYAIVAKNNIYAGSRLTPAMLEMKQIPVKDNADNYFQNADIVSGKVVIANIMAGQPVLKANLDLNSFNIPNGMRLITISSDFVQGLASYINVGAKVDVVSASNNNPSQVVLQNVQVTALGKAATSSSSSSGNNSSSGSNNESIVSSITLQIPAGSSAKLVSALSQGKIQILLRNSGDNSVVAAAPKKIKPATSNFARPRLNVARSFSLPPAPRFNTSKLNALPSLPAPASPAMNPSRFNYGPKVEVIRAGEKQDVQFNSNNI